MLSKRIKSLALSVAIVSLNFSLSAQEESPELNEAQIALQAERDRLLGEMKALLEEIETSGESMERIERLGDLHTESGDAARAVLSYQKAIEEFGGSEDLYYKLAKVLLLMNRPELGLEILKIGVEAFPESPGLQYELGKAYSGSRKYYAAVATLTKAVDLDPENEVFRYHLALAYRDQKKFDKATELVDAMIDAGSEAVVVHLLKGDLLLIGGEERSAVRLLEDLYEKNPDSPDAKRVLNHAYQQYAYKEASDGRLGRAIRTLEDALKVVPNDPETQAGMGSFYQESGDYQKAEESYALVLENAPQYLDVYSLYGSLLELLDQKDEAREMLEKGLAMAIQLKNQAYANRFNTLLGNAPAPAARR